MHVLLVSLLLVAAGNNPAVNLSLEQAVASVPGGKALEIPALTHSAKLEVLPEK